jgi:hypothetical protein
LIVRRRERKFKKIRKKLKNKKSKKKKKKTQEKFIHSNALRLKQEFRRVRFQRVHQESSSPKSSSKEIIPKSLSGEFSPREFI